MIKKKEFVTDLSILILFLLFWFLLFRFTGSFVKGYNVYEDYTVVTLAQVLSEKPIPVVAYDYIKINRDVRARFCPLGDFHRLLMIKFFGIDFILHNIYVVFLGILTSFFLYKFCITAGFSILESFLFGILVVTGPFAIIWSEIGDYESLGMLLLSLALFFAAKSIYFSRHKFQYKLYFIICLTLLPFCKENFILIVPAFLFLYLWLYSLKNHTGIIISIKKNYRVVIALSAIILIFLIFIFLFLGINNQGYAGLDSKELGLSLIPDFVISLFHYHIFWIILFGLVIVFDEWIKNRNTEAGNGFKQNLSKILLNISILFLLIAVPQYILYLKTGLSGRYLLPFMLGFSFYLIYLLKIIFDNDRISRFVKYLYLGTIIIFLFFEIKDNTVPPLVQFSDFCQSNSKLLKSVLKNSDKESTILFVMDPVQNFHEVFSLSVYLNYLNGQNNFKYDFIKRDYLHIFHSDTTRYRLDMNYAVEGLGKDLIDSVKDMKTINSINSIIIFWQLDKKFSEQNIKWFNAEKFRKENFGQYTAYFKK